MTSFQKIQRFAAWQSVLAVLNNDSRSSRRGPINAVQTPVEHHFWIVNNKQSSMVNYYKIMKDFKSVLSEHLD